MIHFKHVFIIGDLKEDFESDVFLRLLHTVITDEMKPFCLLLHRMKGDLLDKEYHHLAIRDN